MLTGGVVTLVSTAVTIRIAPIAKASKAMERLSFLPAACAECIIDGTNLNLLRAAKLKSPATKTSLISSVTP